MIIGITPVVVIPDVSPLSHLAAVGRLTLLQSFGRVVVMDVVALEAADDLSKPWAPEISAWLQRGGRPDTAHPVAVARTEIGEAYRLARQAQPGFRLRNAGEAAVRDWLVETLPELGGPALVVYEDRHLPRLIERERLDGIVVAATTRAVLVFAEERGLIASAEEVWTEIIGQAAGANPSLAARVLRPTRGP